MKTTTTPTDIFQGCPECGASWHWVRHWDAVPRKMGDRQCEVCEYLWDSEALARLIGAALANCYGQGEWLRGWKQPRERVYG